LFAALSAGETPAVPVYALRVTHRQLVLRAQYYAGRSAVAAALRNLER
jgi:hypothetical protein